LYAATYCVFPVVVVVVVVLVVVVEEEALLPPLPHPSARVKKETAVASTSLECERVRVCRVLQSVIIFISIQ
jgi:hypothetical protein